MSFKEKLKDFSFLVFILSFLIIVNFLIIIAILVFTYNEEMLNLFFSSVNIDQINTLFFALTMIYLGIIGVDKLLTPYEEFIKFIKVDNSDNEQTIAHFPEKNLYSGFGLFIVWHI